MIFTQKKSPIPVCILNLMLLLGTALPLWAQTPEKSESVFANVGLQRFAAPDQVGTTGFRRGFTPGDGVSISTYPDTTMMIHGIFAIDDAGFVELPIYGKVRITQMSEQDFANFLLERYKDYLRFPNIQVKPMIRLSVLGGVRRPGFYYFDQDYSLWDVMKEVGGTLDEDGLKQMRWKRDGDVVQKDLIPYLQSGVALKNISFRTGDQIWVRTPGKPGFLERTRSVMSFVTAVASFFTLYITYQRYLILDRR